MIKGVQHGILMLKWLGIHAQIKQIHLLSHCNSCTHLTHLMKTWKPPLSSYYCFWAETKAGMQFMTCTRPKTVWSIPSRLLRYYNNRCLRMNKTTRRKKMRAATIRMRSSRSVLSKAATSCLEVSNRFVRRSFFVEAARRVAVDSSNLWWGEQ